MDSACCIGKRSVFYVSDRDLPELIQQMLTGTPVARVQRGGNMSNQDHKAPAHVEPTSTAADKNPDRPQTGKLNEPVRKETTVSTPQK